EMLDQVPRDQLDPVSGSNYRFQLRPPGFQFLFALDFLALGRFFELRVDLGPLRLLQRQFGEPALVVDRNRRTVDYRALDVVDADVVAEHRSRVGVSLLDRGAGETDERGIGQRVTHVPGETVDEVVLTAMGFIGNDNDISPIRQHWMAVPLSFGEELLD